MFSNIYIWVILAVVVVVGLFFIGCGRHACKHWGSSEKKADWIVKRLTKKLDLNESQVQSLHKIKDEVLVKKGELKGLKAGFHKEVLSQIRNDRVDEQKLNDLFEDKETKMKDMRAFLVAKFVEFHDILTPEQREKLAKKVEKFHGCHGKRCHL